MAANAQNAESFVKKGITLTVVNVQYAVSVAMKGTILTVVRAKFAVEFAIRITRGKMASAAYAGLNAPVQNRSFWQ
jgi:hypothetical protein